MINKRKQQIPEASEAGATELAESGQGSAPDVCVKDGDVVRLDRPGIQACGRFRARVDYTVGKDGLTVEQADRLVRVKGFVKNPPPKPSAKTDSKE